MLKSQQNRLMECVLCTLVTLLITFLHRSAATHTSTSATTTAEHVQPELSVHYCCPDLAVYNMTLTQCDEHVTQVDWLPPWSHQNGTLMTIGENTVYTLITGFPNCKALMYQPDVHPMIDDFILLSSGALFFPHYKTTVQPDKSCIVEVINSAVTNSDSHRRLHYAAVCDGGMELEGAQRKEVLSDQLRNILYTSAMAISEVFLVLTLICYLLVPELRDLQGKTIMCTIISLLFGYLMYIIVNTASRHMSSGTCFGFGLLLHYWLMTTFFWLSAVSVTVFFSTTKWSNLSVEEERHRFIYLSLFGWLTPFVFTLSAIIVEYSPLHPEYSLKPNIGAQWCWFGNRKAELAYFFGPVTVLLVINMTLFIASNVIIYRQSRNGTQKLNNDGEHKQKNSLKMCVKLFTVMGITWIFEMLQFFINDRNQAVWIVFDLINILQGVLIFVAVILSEKNVRRKVYTAIASRSIHWWPFRATLKTGDITRLEEQGRNDDVL